MSPDEARRLIRKLAADADEVVFEGGWSQYRIEGTDLLRATAKLQRDSVKIREAGGISTVLALARQEAPHAAR